DPKLFCEALLQPLSWQPRKSFETLLPRNISTTAVIRVNNGIVHCSKGSVSSSALRGVQRVIEEASIAHGKIRMTKAGKIRFSDSIPASDFQSGGITQMAL